MQDKDYWLAQMGNDFMAMAESIGRKPLLGLVKVLIGILLTPFLLIFMAIGKPISWLFCQLANLFTIGGIRYRHGQIQVATDIYRHQQSGRKIVLLGMTHEAEQIFYAKIRAQLETFRQAGYQITGEGISMPSKTRMKILSPIQRQWVRQFMKHLHQTRSEMAILLNLKLQRNELTGLQYRNHDVDAAGLYAAYLQESILPPTYYETDTDSIYQAHVRQNLNTLPQRLVGQMMSVALISALIRPFIRNSFLKIILGWRDQQAAEKILAAASESDIASHWGASHLAGIGKILRQHGYQQVSREWNTAMNAATLEIHPDFRRYVRENLPIHQLEPFIIYAAFSRKE